MNTQGKSGLNRRTFLKASAIAVMGTALAGNRFGAGISFAQGGSNDLDILNYALTLEHLEARAYSDIVASGLVSGVALGYFQAFGAHEAAHVTALSDVIRQLGGTPVQAQRNYAWPTFRNQQEVLTYFHMVEELGAAAYLGQAPRIENDDILTAAVSIHNVEGQHAAVLADLIGVPPSPAFAEAKTMQQVLSVITPILQADMPDEMPETGLGGRAIGRNHWIAN